VLTADQCADLADLFLAHDYTVDAVVTAVSEGGQRALGRNHTVPAERALAGRGDPLATLIRLWPLQQAVPRKQVEAALAGLLVPLLRGRVLAGEGDRVRALVDIRPYASDTRTFWVGSDLTPNLDGVLRTVRPDLVLGVSAASTTLAQLTPRSPVARALDLGTGCGVQSLHLAVHAQSVIATDLNPRAVELAALTFGLNGLGVELREGNLFAPVADERFDLITTNPPYVIAPPSGDARLMYREAGLAGDALVERIVRHGSDHLAEGGTLCLLANWAHRDSVPWAQRVAGWIPPGCDAHVVQREVLDPSEYVELWLADAGLTGSPGYRRRYARWLDYFAELGIEAIGLGWIVVHRSGREPASVRVEQWPYPLEQPIAPAILREREGADLERSLSEAGLLAGRWVVADDVVEESAGPPGAADPHRLVLRQQRGFRRAVEVDTALAAVVGACDGDLSLGRIVAAVAHLLGMAADDLRGNVVPSVRRLVIEGYLLRLR
jgi:hypothetical protein